VDLHDTKPGRKKGRERIALLNNIPKILFLKNLTISIRSLLKRVSSFSNVENANLSNKLKTAFENS